MRLEDHESSVGLLGVAVQVDGPAQGVLDGVEVAEAGVEVSQSWASMARR